MIIPGGFSITVALRIVKDVTCDQPVPCKDWLQPKRCFDWGIQCLIKTI